MKDISYSNKEYIPNYVIVSFALVQSELFWVCSAIFCLFRESRLLIEQPITLTTRNRSNSASVTLSKRSKKDDYVKLKNNELKEIYQQKRISSLSIENVGLRVRPSTKDELIGTTCPPLWWQKTRVMLGYTAIHGDPKPTKSISLTNSVSSIELTSVNANTSSHSDIFFLPILRNRSMYSTSSSAESEKQLSKRKLISKFNAALHSHHSRRNRATELKPM